MEKINKIYKERFLYKNVKLTRFENFKISNVFKFIKDDIIYQEYFSHNYSNKLTIFYKINLYCLLYNKDSDVLFFDFISKNKYKTYKKMLNSLKRKQLWKKLILYIVKGF